MTDFRSLKLKGSRSDAPKPVNSSRRWWEMKGPQCAQAIAATIETLKKNQTVRIRQSVVSSRLYGNLSMHGTAGAAYARLLAAQTAVRDRLSYNAIQSICDTLVSHVGEQKPRPYYLTSGGNYKQQRKAKKLSQFTDGVFYETKTYRVGPKAFRDALIWGDGFIHVFERGGKLHHERVVAAELWIDEVEGQHGSPRNLHREMSVDRDELAGYFPEDRKAIFDCSPIKDTGTQTESDMVRVVESWHRGAENEEGKLIGGAHTICLPDAKLVLGDEKPDEWEFDFFPFARIPWCERPLGYWSQGLCEQLQGDQLELNKLLYMIQRSMHLAGTIKVAIPVGSKVVKEQISNEIGVAYTYTGERPPTFFTSAPVDSMVLEQPNRIIERMYRRSGVSEFSASGVKPTGLDSAPSQREYKDTQTERHKSIGEVYDDFYLTLAMMDRKMAKGLKGYKVRVPSRNSVTEIDWGKDIGSFKDEEFILKCYATSMLPKDPAGRMQTIQEQVQAGWITPRRGRQLMDFPDTEADDSLALAQEELLMKTLDAIVDDGEYAPPEPTDDLQLSLETVLHYIQLYRRLELEPEKVDLLRKYKSQVDTLITRAMPPAPMAAPGGPQAVPAPPPVSGLLPNNPNPAA